MDDSNKTPQGDASSGANTPGPAKAPAPTPRVSSATPTPTSRTIELKPGQVLVGLKGNEAEAFITTKKEWETMYSLSKGGDGTEKFVLLDEKKS